MPTTSPVDTDSPWFQRTADECLIAFGSSDEGLSATVAEQRLQVNGSNSLPTPPRPSAPQVVLLQWRDPMTVLLTVLIGVGVVVDQVETAVLVALLVLINVALGAQQQLRARASADDLESMTTPTAKVRRDGRVQLVAASELVVGDILVLESGDVIPADARIVTSASLEVVGAPLPARARPLPRIPLRFARTIHLSVTAPASCFRTRRSRGLGSRSCSRHWNGDRDGTHRNSAQ
ncbi:MAG: cation-transporting P-type ATPase [Candidatus Nanopelagicales bacterium]